MPTEIHKAIMNPLIKAILRAKAEKIIAVNKFLTQANKPLLMQNIIMT